MTGSAEIGVTAGAWSARRNITETRTERQLRILHKIITRAMRELPCTARFKWRVWNAASAQRQVSCVQPLGISGKLMGIPTQGGAVFVDGSERIVGHSESAPVRPSMDRHAFADG